jgi:hypothetical protein
MLRYSSVCADEIRIALFSSFLFFSFQGAAGTDSASVVRLRLVLAANTAALPLRIPWVPVVPRKDPSEQTAVPERETAPHLMVPFSPVRAPSSSIGCYY